MAATTDKVDVRGLRAALARGDRVKAPTIRVKAADNGIVGVGAQDGSKLQPQPTGGEAIQLQNRNFGRLIQPRLRQRGGGAAAVLSTDSEFDNRPLILKPWSKSVRTTNVAALSHFPCGLWVRLPGIKAHIADVRILSLLFSRLEKPICTDGVTADGLSYNYARVCVEVYADVELQDVIEYQDPYGNFFVQRVIYEWRPHRCPNCCNFGRQNTQNLI
ncbi:unnamed protein product [Rhodiola kirilowii]